MARIVKDARKFSAGNKESAITKLFNKMEDYLNHAQTQSKGAQGLFFNKEVSLSDKHVAMSGLLFDAVQSLSNVPYPTELEAIEGREVAVMRYASNPSVKSAMFTVLDIAIGMVLPDALIAEMGTYADVRFIGFGDTANFKLEANSLYQVYKMSRDQKHMKSQREYVTNVTLNPQYRGVTVEGHWYKILSGEDNLARFVIKAADSITYQMSIDVYEAFNTALGTLEVTPSPRELRVVGYNEDSLLQLCQKVSAWNNSTAVIMGSKLSLGKVLPATVEYRVQIDSPYVSAGFIPRYKGYDLVEMEQKADYRTPFETIIDDDKLYIVSPGSDKIIKVAVENGVITNVDSTFMNADLSQDATVRSAWDIGAITNSVSGLMTLS